MREPYTARNDEQPPGISEVIARMIRMYGYDAVRDELEMQAVVTTDDDLSDGV